MKSGKDNRGAHNFMRNSDFKTLSSTIYQTLRDDILDGRVKILGASPEAFDIRLYELETKQASGN